MKLICSFLLSLFALSASAETPEITINHVSYYINKTEGYAVAAKPTNSSELTDGDIVVQKTVEYSGEIYPVKSFGGYEVEKAGQKIILPEGITEIGGESPGAVFCTLPQTIERILPFALAYTSLPTNIYFPNIEIVGPASFYKSGVKKLRLGTTLRILGTKCYDDELEELVMESSDEDTPLTLSGGSLCMTNSEIILPSRKNLIISDCAVAQCINLQRIVFPDIEQIKYGAEDSYKATTNIVELNGLFIQNCPNLKEVVCLSKVPTEITDLDRLATYPIKTTSEFKITDNTDQCILKVPAGSEHLYASHPIWGKFNIIYGFEGGDYTSVATINTDNGSDILPKYYNLQGLEVKNIKKGQLYIRVNNGQAEKIVF